MGGREEGGREVRRERQIQESRPQHTEPHIFPMPAGNIHCFEWHHWKNPENIRQPTLPCTTGPTLAGQDSPTKQGSSAKSKTRESRSWNPYHRSVPCHPRTTAPGGSTGRVIEDSLRGLPGAASRFLSKPLAGLTRPSHPLQRQRRPRACVPEYYTHLNLLACSLKVEGIINK